MLLIARVADNKKIIFPRWICVSDIYLLYTDIGNVHILCCNSIDSKKRILLTEPTIIGYVRTPKYPKHYKNPVRGRRTPHLRMS